MQFRDPEEIIAEYGPTREVFRALYQDDDDPWYTNGSQAEKVRLAITKREIEKLIEYKHSKDPNHIPTMLDFACGNVQWSFPRDFVHVARYDWASQDSMLDDLTSPFNIVLALNVMSYYNATERLEIRKSLMNRVLPGGFYLESNPTSHQKIVLPLGIMVSELSQLGYDILAVIPIELDWQNNLEYRDSDEYRTFLLSGDYKCVNVTQHLVICRKV